MKNLFRLCLTFRKGVISYRFKKPNQNLICLKIPGPDMKEGKHGGRPLCSYLEPQNTKGSVTSNMELDGAEFI